MTQPKMTYGIGFTDDCHDVTAYTKEGNLTANLTSDGDIFTITGTPNNSGNEYVTFERTIPALSTTSCPKCLVKWKTSVPSNGLEPKINFVYTVGNKQVTLGFSTTWKVTEIDLDTAKTLVKIQLSADDNPNSLASGTYYVYFDFVMVRDGIFSFPKVDNVSLETLNDYVDTEMPNRVGEITEYISMLSPSINLIGVMDSNESWGNPLGLFLYVVMYGAHGAPFQWFESDVINCKVTARRFVISQDKDSGWQRTWIFELKLYSRGSGNAPVWTGLEWLGL